MTDGMPGGTPGWYLDRDDPALARWHDGDGWTEHTLVIADQEPGSDPPPPPATRRMSDAALQRERNLAMQEKKAAREAARQANQGSRYPRWVPVAVAALVGLLCAGAFVMLSGDDDDPTTDLQTEQAASIEDAVAAARDAGFPDEIGDARASGLVEDLCEAAERPSRTAALGAELNRLPLEPAELTTAIRALGQGAEELCPDESDGIATAVAQLQSLAGTDPLTDTTLPSVDGGVVDGSVTTLPGDTTATTKPTTATTKKPTTATTAAPTTTTIPPTTTTTLPKVSPVQKSCSTEGAQAMQAGAPVTCKPACGNGGGLEWRRDGQSCPTTPTVPTTN
jgi:hypothetical protein